MGTNGIVKNCPVCRMQITRDYLHALYRGIDFWFCSEQCRKRFEAFPRLYVGDPQHGLSAKQQGKKAYKSHVIRLHEPLDNETAEQITERLQRMMGVASTTVNDAEILINYDLMEVSLAELEAAIVDEHQALHPGIVSRITRAWIHDSEICELENLGNLPASYSGNTKN